MIYDNRSPGNCRYVSYKFNAGNSFIFHAFEATNLGFLDPHLLGKLFLSESSPFSGGLTGPSDCNAQAGSLVFGGKLWILQVFFNNAIKAGKIANPFFQ